MIVVGHGTETKVGRRGGCDSYNKGGNFGGGSSYTAFGNFSGQLQLKCWRRTLRQTLW